MAIEFAGTGSGQHVDFGAFDLSSGLTALSIMSWVIFDSFTLPDQRIISKATSHNNEDHWWMFSGITSTQMRVRLKTNGTTLTHFEDSAQLYTGRLYHLGFVWDGSYVNFKRDGQSTGSSAQSGTLDTNGSVEVRIADNPGTNRLELDGTVEEVRIYERALTNVEVLSQYAARGLDRNMDGLVHWWKLNEGAAGTTASGMNRVIDWVGGIHGTPSASPVYRGSKLRQSRALA